MKATHSAGQSEAAKTISSVLSCFNYEKEELGISEIARELDAYPSKIYRIVATLSQNGLLEQNPTNKKYKIGLKLFEIGSLYLTNLNVRRIVRNHALRLAKYFETDVHLGILSKSPPYYIVIVDRFVQSDTSIQRIHFNVPPYSSALGKAILAFLEDNLRFSIIQKLEFVKHTSSTITDGSRLEEELKLIRTRRYSYDQEETRENLCCIGVPIRDRKSVIAALSVSGTCKKIEKNKNKIIEELILTSDLVSYQLGH